MPIASQTPKKRRVWFISIVVVSLLGAATLLVMFVHNWKEKSKVADCCINLRNYNGGIAGAICISNEPAETWSDPEAVVKLLKEKLEVDLPTCPDGGTYSLIYEPDSPNLPKLVCSKEESHGHGLSNN